MPTDQCLTREGGIQYITDFITTMDGYAQTYVDISNNVNIGAGNIIPNTQLNNLFKTLTYLKKQLTAQIKQLKSSIERHNRSFLDLEDVANPNTGSIHTLDDYTLWTLVLSYVFFAITVVFCYSHLNNYTPKAIAISVGGMALISMFLFVIAITML
jgi:hypothetical protein